MGACATKPKAEGAEVPIPEPEKEDRLVADSKLAEKAVDVVALEEADSGGCKVVGDEVDDQSDRRRSLSHLFRENEEESKAKMEPSEELDSSETVKTTEEVEKKLPEAAEQLCTTQTKETTADNVISSETSETEKTVESGVEMVTKEIELDQEKLDSSETVETTVEVEKLLEVKQPCTTQNEETTIDIVETCKPAEIEKGIESEPEQADSSETVITTYEAEKNLPEAEQPCTTQDEETAANIVISSEATEIEKVAESGPETETVTEKIEQEEEKIDSSETVKTIAEAEKKLSEIEQLCMTQNQETVTDNDISSKPAQIEKGTESGPETVSDEGLLVSNKDKAEKAEESAGKVEAVCAPEKPDVKSEEIEVKVVGIEEKN